MVEVRIPLSEEKIHEIGLQHKKEAVAEEVEKRKELKTKKQDSIQDLIVVKTDMAFLDLVNSRLDFIKAYESEKYYVDTLTSAKRWTRQWGEFMCKDISSTMVQSYMIHLKENISAFTANKELQYDNRDLFTFI